MVRLTPNSENVTKEPLKLVFDELTPQIIKAEKLTGQIIITIEKKNTKKTLP